jgi:hypothetical protein
MTCQEHEVIIDLANTEAIGWETEVEFTSKEVTYSNEMMKEWMANCEAHWGMPKGQIVHKHSPDP